jgi:DNA-binding GntR family transcriptional regulator
LVKAELAGAYGVSKTPVCDALSSLARGGLVDLDPVRGARIHNFTADGVREIYEMRASLEPFALEKAVPRMDENDRELLRSLLDVADDAADRVDLYGLSALNRKFYDVLVARCHNKRILESIDRVQDNSERSSCARGCSNPPIREKPNDTKVAKALESRNAHRTADLLRMHIVGLGEHFVRR